MISFVCKVPAKSKVFYYDQYVKYGGAGPIVVQGWGPEYSQSQSTKTHSYFAGSQGIERGSGESRLKSTTYGTVHTSHGRIGVSKSELNCGVTQDR